MTIDNYIIGPHAQVDAGVTLGYSYPGWSEKLRIGEHAIIRSGSILYAGSTIGKRFTCGHQVLIRAECRIGDRVVILHQCALEGKITIGNVVKIMAQVYIPSRTVIGDFVFIGPGCTFLNHRTPMRTDEPVVGATIEDRVCIGGGCTICPGVRIGRNSFIGAGALVNKDVPPDTLAFGVPARFQPLPENLRGGNRPKDVLSGTDLWAGQVGDDWRADYPEIT
jgi:acetyltransferase-like isoleucine patch superfamily enzyme